MYRKEAEVQRVNELFSLLASGSLADEAYFVVDSNPEGSTGALRRGEYRETFVSTVIGKAEFVERAWRTGFGSLEDHAGIDIIASTYDDLVPEVYVQVKSRQRDVRKFYKNIAKRHGINNNDVSQWLVEHGIIVIVSNGTTSEEEVLRAFLDGFDEISEYVKKTGKGVKRII